MFQEWGATSARRSGRSWSFKHSSSDTSSPAPLFRRSSSTLLTRASSLLLPITSATLSITTTLLVSSSIFHIYQLICICTWNKAENLIICMDSVVQWGKAAMDPEPGRCRRTDGKKWRCSRDVVAGNKYCERHMHRGKNRSRKPVEPAATHGGEPNASSPSLGMSAASGGGAAPRFTLSGPDLIHHNHNRRFLSS